jgi:gliding motility-associated protein GldE
LENPDPYPSQSLLFIFLQSVSGEVTIELVGFLGLVLLSAFVSAAESAYFSLTKSQIIDIQDNKVGSNKLIIDVLSKPKYLLASLLLSATIVNIAVAILTANILDILLAGQDETLKFTVEIVGVVFTLVLFGEITPKVYAANNSITIAKLLAYPIYIVNKFFYPVSWLLVKSTTFIEKRVAIKGHNLKIDEIKQAIELTAGEAATKEEKKILQGIVSFSTTNVKQVMTNRTEICAIEYDTSYDDLISFINKYEYSRIPVYREVIDKIEGVLYIKDLLPFMAGLTEVETDQSIPWQSLLRQPYFVPQSKMIDDLLEEFQSKKVHLAIAVDEYGGTSGIITMEDILEEIVGDIKDEFDDDEVLYQTTAEGDFIFSGKTSLNDVFKALEVNDDYFDDFRGEAETIGGLTIELFRKLPRPGEVFANDYFTLKVEMADKKRVKEVMFSFNNKSEREEEEGKE